MGCVDLVSHQLLVNVKRWRVFLMIGMIAMGMPLSSLGKDSLPHSMVDTSVKPSAWYPVWKFVGSQHQQEDSLLFVSACKPPQAFINTFQVQNFCAQIPEKLQQIGFVAAAVDEYVFQDSLVIVQVFIGERWKWDKIHWRNIPERLLKEVGWNKQWEEGWYQLGVLNQVKEKMVGHLASRGYPFASVQIDSLVLEEGKAQAWVTLDSGRVYTIDSIRIFGEFKVNKNFLERYLQLPPGGLYRKDRLEMVSKRLNDLDFLREKEPWRLSMLGTGSVLDLYLEPRKSSIVDLLIGFLPGSDQPGGRRFLLTGDANIQLKNALQQGEKIGVRWQQLQVQSPRLKLNYQQPYLFGSAFGTDIAFELFKKDSSFLNLQANLGVQYLSTAEQQGKIFLQFFRTNLISPDTNFIKITRQLPEQIDLGTTQVGIQYQLEKTDYRLNPRKGYAADITLSAGQKTIRPNNGIISLVDPNFNFQSLYDSIQLRQYQLQLSVLAARYFPLGQQSTVKLGFQGGWLESPDIFRNELFQIGGYRTLRGFDEQSLFVSGYGILTGEYRYLLGRNSFLSAFTDWAYTRNNSSFFTVQGKNAGYWGAGIGMTFETKGGIFNLNWAVGSGLGTNNGTGNQSGPNLQQSKIHFGYVNYF